MKMTKFLLLFAISVMAASFLSSCESSKIAYGNSYYFKQTPKKIAPTQTQEKELVASIEKESTEVVPVDDQVKRSVSQLATLAKEKAELTSALRSEKHELTPSEKKSIRQDRRENKRAMRKELKTLVKEYRSSPEEFKESFSLKEVTGNLRTGIIIGGVGLILMIIGGYSVLYIIGSVLLVVGLVLILIDIL